MKLLATLFLLTGSFFSFGQMKISTKLIPGNHRQIHFLQTDRGDYFIGQVVRIDSGFVLFKIHDTVISQFDFSDIEMLGVYKKEKIKPPKKARKSNLAERILFSPTAFMLAKGELEFSNQVLLANNLNYGIKKHLTLGAGVWPFPGQKFGWVHLKSAIAIKPNLHAAVGGQMVVGLVNDSYDEYKQIQRLLFSYGALTFGNPDKYCNLSFGKALYDKDGSAKWIPWVYTIGGAIKTSERTSWYLELGDSLPTTQAFNFNIGLNVFGKRSRTTIGLASLFDSAGLPLFSYTRIL